MPDRRPPHPPMPGRPRPGGPMPGGQRPGRPKPGGPGTEQPGPGMQRMDKPKKLKTTVKRIWGYLRKKSRLLIFITLCIVVATLLGIWGPYLIGLAIDGYILTADLRGLIRILALLASVFIFSSLLSYVQMYISAFIAQQTTADMREDLFAKLQKLPLRFFDSKTHGEIMSRLTNDIDNVSNMLNMGIAQVVSGTISVIGTLVFMLYISPVLTLISSVSVPLILLVTRMITGKASKFFDKNQKILGELNGKLEEIVSGQRVVKVFTRENVEIEAFDNINDELNKVGISAQIYAGIMGPAMNLLNNASYVVLVAVGGLLCMMGHFEVGMIASFTIYARQFTWPLSQISQQYNMLLAAVAGAERVFEIMDEQPEPDDDSDAVVIDDLHGGVALTGVNFGYEADRLILKDVNLYAKPGQTIALVGPTGAGKTTIINLLSRFYDIGSGSITIDGIDIKKIKRGFLRGALGIVLQDTYLFAGTINENIRYGRLNATDEEIINASKLANAHEFVRRLPHGYDTELTENADNLSHGQKQMLAIARAILADPFILILDEATSNVDTRTERKIQEAMLNLMKNRTCFVIAHRLSTIKNADLIAVINNGEIVERGSHKELLEQKGFYYNLYSSQFNDEAV